MEIEEINRLFETSQQYEEFKTTNGKQLRIGDYVRVNKIAERKYIHQGMYKIGFSFIGGLRFELVGIYKEEHKVEPNNKYKYKLECEYNQWLGSTSFNSLQFYKEKEQQVWYIDGEVSDVFKIENPRDEIKKITLLWHVHQNFVKEIDKITNRDRTDQNDPINFEYEATEKYIHENLDKLNF